MVWIKVLHILCVMGWMTSIFAVPRALIYWKREYDHLQGFGPLGDLTFRLYRFSAGLAVIAVLSGLYMAFQLGWPSWSLVKLALVAGLAAHYVWTGRMVGQAKRGEFRHSDMFLRIFNETSVIGAIAILWIVVAQPF